MGKHDRLFKKGKINIHSNEYDNAIGRAKTKLVQKHKEEFKKLLRKELAIAENIGDGK